MDRFLDKAVVLACCLVAAGCALVESDAMQAAPMQAGEAALPFATSMLAALLCSAATEAVSLPVGIVGFSLYCAVACFVPQAEVFVPLAVYDFMRCIHRDDALRFAGAFAICALVAGMLAEALPPLATGAALCACLAAAALSIRTNTALARQRIAHAMRDELASQTLSLNRKNRNLTENLAQLESRDRDGSSIATGASRKLSRSDDTRACETDTRTDNDVEAPGSRTRPATFACLSEREFEVARLVAEGLDNREIAAAAYLSEGTVRNNISSILSKMTLKNRTQIAVTYWKSIK